MANNYKALQSQFRGLVEKRTASFVAAGKEDFLRKSGVKPRKNTKGASLIANRVNYTASRAGYKEAHSLILEQMLVELHGAKKGKVTSTMLTEAAKRVSTNAKTEEVASL